MTENWFHLAAYPIDLLFQQYDRQHQLSLSHLLADNPHKPDDSTDIDMMLSAMYDFDRIGNTSLHCAFYLTADSMLEPSHDLHNTSCHNRSELYNSVCYIASVV